MELLHVSKPVMCIIELLKCSSIHFHSVPILKSNDLTPNLSTPNPPGLLIWPLIYPLLILQGCILKVVFKFIFFLCKHCNAQKKMHVLIREILMRRKEENDPWKLDINPTKYSGGLRRVSANEKIGQSLRLNQVLYLSLILPWETILREVVPFNELL